MKKIKNYLHDNLALWIVLGVALLCSIFLIVGTESENGSITLDGSDAVITESTEKFIEDANDALYRIMNQDKPTDEETIEANDEEATGQGSYTTLDAVIGRMLKDGDNDGGNGWQCSKYTAYLATGKRSYSTSHPDYGPVNGKDVAAWLVKNYGWKYISTPVKGAIGSGGFNTTYGHTVMYLYSTGTNTAMVNDANWSPLKVATHSMSISGYVWVVPGDYTEESSKSPETSSSEATEGNNTGTTTSVNSYTVVRGDTLGGIALKLGWYSSVNGLYGDSGYAQKLAEKNNILNRGLIYPGQTIEKY